jgi:hypothetical protein
MADSGAIRAGRAYVEMGVDNRQLLAGLGAGQKAVQRYADSLGGIQKAMKGAQQSAMGFAKVAALTGSKTAAADFEKATEKVRQFQQLSGQVGQRLGGAQQWVGVLGEQATGRRALAERLAAFKEARKEAAETIKTANQANVALGGLAGGVEGHTGRITQGIRAFGRAGAAIAMFSGDKQAGQLFTLAVACDFVALGYEKMAAACKRWGVATTSIATAGLALVVYLLNEIAKAYQSNKAAAEEATAAAIAEREKRGENWQAQIDRAHGMQAARERPEDEGALQKEFAAWRLVWVSQHNRRMKATPDSTVPWATEAYAAGKMTELEGLIEIEKRGLAAQKLDEEKAAAAERLTAAGRQYADVMEDIAAYQQRIAEEAAGMTATQKANLGLLVRAMQTGATYAIQQAIIAGSMSDQADAARKLADEEKAKADLTKQTEEHERQYITQELEKLKTADEKRLEYAARLQAAVDKGWMTADQRDKLTALAGPKALQGVVRGIFNPMALLSLKGGAGGDPMKQVAVAAVATARTNQKIADNTDRLVILAEKTNVFA